MKYTINTDLCTKYELSLSEILLLMLVKSCDNVQTLIRNALNKELIIEDTEHMGSYLVTQRWDDVMASMLIDSEIESPAQFDARLEQLALELMDIFPRGKKEGTNVYWRGNVKDTKLRLKKFFHLYGNKYSDKQIINATRNYVASFNGNYAYMRVLKYFIWKDEKKVNAEGKMFIEEVSDLASFIENEGSTNEDRDWTSTLI